MGFRLLLASKVTLITSCKHYYKCKLRNVSNVNLVNNVNYVNSFKYQGLAYKTAFFFCNL